MFAERVIKLIASFFAVTFVLTLHEFSHAFVAVKCGDPTPKWNKRLSLNPFRHFDLMGLVCFTLVGFGWAKPVPINPGNFKRYRLGLGLTASAGIIVNYISALLFWPLVLVVWNYMPAVPVLSDFLWYFTNYLFAYSLGFCVFNLLPLAPLDGFRIVEAVNRKRGPVFRFIRDYGHWILLGLIVESFLCQIFVDFGVFQMRNFDILGWVMEFATDIFGWPNKALWGLLPW